MENRQLNLIVGHLKPKYLNFRKMALKSAMKLPIKVDLRSQMSPIKDQGNLGSCTAFALGGCVEYMYRFQQPSLPFLQSELFLYFNERKVNNSIGYDSGAYLHDGVKCLINYGACSQNLWPYIISNFRTAPNTTCYNDAKNHQALKTYNIPQTAEAMKTSLSQGIPFVIGIAVYSSFMTSAVASTGVVPFPNTSREKLMGGHAIMCVGYDDSNASNPVFIMRNSWGTKWGQNGYFTIPQKFLLTPALSTDIWALQKME